MIDEIFVRLLHLDGQFVQDGAGAVERDEIGRAEALAGQDHEAVLADGDIGDDRIADDYGLRLIGKLDDLGAIGRHHELFGLRRAEGEKEDAEKSGQNGESAAARTRVRDKLRMTNLEKAGPAETPATSAALHLLFTGRVVNEWLISA